MVLKHFLKRNIFSPLSLSSVSLDLLFFSFIFSLSFSLSTSLSSLFSLPSSLLLSFSSLFSLFSSLVLIFSSLVFHLLLPSCLVSSSSLPSSLLSFSVFFPCLCLSLSPCDVACCVVLCCGGVGHAENLVCRFKTPSVSRFKTSPCVPASRAHVETLVGVVPGDVLNRDTEGVLNVHAVPLLPPLPTQTDTHTHQTQHQRNICGVVWCGVCCANFLLTMNGPRGVITWPQRFTESNQ